MKKTTRVVLVMAGLALAGCSEVAAQGTATTDTMTFVQINALAQPSTRNIDITKTDTVYGEPSTLTTTQHIGNGVVFDVAGGYVFRPRMSIGLGFSTFSNTGNSSGSVVVPDPIVFNRPRTVGISATGLKHRENAVHIQFRYAVPFRDKMEGAIVLGPSIFMVKQQLVSSVSIAPATQNATAIVSEETKTAVGVNVGVEGNYYFSRMLGAGIVLRYAGASAKLPSFSGLKVGGFQAGVGVRFRF